ncbi:MAG TPA: four helix bundle protein, partial [Gemmatimonadales bacterium]|nr:four helix bundle protein [Gemmatimonadales bacterium]
LRPRDYGTGARLVSSEIVLMMPYEKWKAWQRSHELALAIYTETGRWPSEERYGLIAQARRSAVSVPKNLAEGSARLGGRELRRFADIGLGSLSELSYLLRLSRDLGYMSQESWSHLDLKRDAAGRLLFGLVRAIGKRRPDV